MAYKCRVCGINEVDHQGGICELCALAQDPYAQDPYAQDQASKNNFQATAQDNIDTNQSSGSYIPKRVSNRKVLLHGGASLANQDPYGNDMTNTADTEPSVKVYTAGQVPQSTQQTTSVATTTNATKISINQPVTTGITKNIFIDNQKKSILAKWFRALFTGIPFTLDDDVTMFQVFPDFSGTTLNTLGNACDQVIVYGRLNNGTISENNDVEVYGRRDSKNNIIAKMIKNKASGTTITPTRTISQGAVWLITALIVTLFAMMLSGLNSIGIVWILVAIICLTSLPLIIKIFAAILGAIFSLIKRLF